ncbi:MAG: hypothetical protein PHU85_00330 [Phycisphaerae bacterium]|nr:hypothetical protein [Phycisphaerae bacterium]
MSVAPAILTAAPSETATPMVPILRGFWLWLHTPPGAAAQARMRAAGVVGPITGPCVIKDKDAHLITLVPNSLQTDVYLAMLEQAKLGLPVRVLILKYRKPGCSTIVEALGYYLVKHYPHRYAQVVAHTESSTRDIFEITARMFVYDPEHTSQPKWPAASTLDFQDQHDSWLQVRTFGGQYISSSANIQFLHLSELAKVAGDQESVQQQMLSVSNSVADSPFTVIVIESTANGADTSGEFERRARLAMKGEGSFAFVFAPWYDEPRAVLGDEAPLPALTEPKEIAAEAELLERVPQLSNAQLRWRRQKIADSGSLIKFMQDFPSTPDEAFSVAEGRVFPALRKERHGLHRPVGELLADGYQLYRGFDWGGVDPFVTLCVAHHRDRPTQFTVDIGACPHFWHELTHLTYGPRGRPRDENNHGVDVIRYIATFWNFTGHGHVFAEWYDPDFAAQGRSIDDNAADVHRLCEAWSFTGGVGDRSRPDCINSFRKAGICLQPYTCEAAESRGQEVQYGVDFLNRLIVASAPARYPAPPLTRDQRDKAFTRRTGLKIGYAGVDAVGRALERNRELASVGGGGRGRW